MDQPFYTPQELNLEIELKYKDNFKVEQMNLLLDFLRQICYVDVNADPAFIKLP